MSLALAIATLGGCTEDPTRGGAPALPAKPRARLGTLVGDVKIKRAVADEWMVATEKMELFDNDKLRTAKGASAGVQFTNGSVLTLGEDALIGIAEDRPAPGRQRSDVTVLRGRVDAELESSGKQSLSVATPTATVRAGREIVFQ